MSGDNIQQDLPPPCSLVGSGVRRLSAANRANGVGLLQGAGNGGANLLILAATLRRWVGRLELPSGRYTLGGILTLAAGQTLAGISRVGGGTTLVLGPGAMLLLEGDGASVEDLAIEGPGWRGGNTLVAVDGSQCRLARLAIRHGAVGLRIGIANGVTLTRIVSCQFEDCATGIEVGESASLVTLQSVTVTTNADAPAPGWGIQHGGALCHVLASRFEAQKQTPEGPHPAINVSGTSLSCRYSSFIGFGPYVRLGRPQEESEGGTRENFVAGGGHVIEGNVFATPDGAKGAKAASTDGRPAVATTPGAGAVVRNFRDRLGECTWNLLKNGSFEFWPAELGPDEQGLPLRWRLSDETIAAEPFGPAGGPLRITRVAASREGVDVAAATAYGPEERATYHVSAPVVPGRLIVGSGAVEDCVTDGAPTPNSPVPISLLVPTVRDGQYALGLSVPPNLEHAVELIGEVVPTPSRGPGTDTFVTFSTWARAVPSATPGATMDVFPAIQVDGRRYEGTRYRFDSNLGGLWQRLSVRAPRRFDTAGLAPILVVDFRVPVEAEGSPNAEVVFDGALLNPGMLIGEASDAPVTASGGDILGPIDTVIGLVIPVAAQLNEDAPSVRLPILVQATLESVFLAGPSGTVTVTLHAGPDKLAAATFAVTRVLGGTPASDRETAGLNWEVEPGMDLEVSVEPAVGTVAVELRFRKKAFQ